MAFSSYQATLNYLYAQLPMFTRLGASALTKDLQNTIDFCKQLGNPQESFKSIHIGGTNGKGSSSHMLAAILQEAGYKTGLYTSPHLKDFRERIRINGKMISEEAVIAFVNSNQASFEKLHPSFFEATVAMAFDYFAKEKVDIALIEVGLGGRLDSTNIIQPILSLITNISSDHQDVLGNSLAEIAAEKAGIIKANTPVIIGTNQAEIDAVFEQYAEKEQAPICFANEEWAVKLIKQTEYLHIEASHTRSKKILALSLDLRGSYQLKNISGVLSAVDTLREQGFTISDNIIQKALKNVTRSTGLQGRWQTLQQQPLVICDTGHNEDGVKEVLKNIADTPHQHLHLVWGMVKDKDVSKILSLLPTNATYYFCQPNIPRGKSAEELALEAKQYGLLGDYYASVAEAYQTACSQAKPNDLIFVGGSTFVVAEVL